jgi:hypothetical protein
MLRCVRLSSIPYAAKKKKREKDTVTFIESLLLGILKGLNK